MWPFKKTIEELEVILAGKEAEKEAIEKLSVYWGIGKFNIELLVPLAVDIAKLKTNIAQMKSKQTNVIYDGSYNGEV